MLTAIIAMLLQSSVAISEPSNWRDYTNARFGYTICYPPTMRAEPEATNGDGRVIRARDGGTITVFGSNDDSSLAAYVRGEATGGKVTYDVSKANWNVQSGFVGSSIFWRKTFKRRDQFLVAEVRYPIAAKEAYAPIVKTISTCFSAGSPAF